MNRTRVDNRFIVYYVHNLSEVIILHKYSSNKIKYVTKIVNCAFHL